MISDLYTLLQLGDEGFGLMWKDDLWQQSSTTGFGF